MSTVHWLGAGLSSLPGIRKIALSEQKMILWNRTLSNAEEAVVSIGVEVEVRQLDWPTLDESIIEGDVVVSMLPVNLHLQVAELCLSKNAHFISSSYISPEMQSLHEETKSKELCFVNEVGLDPGLDHILAHALMAAYQSSESFNKDNEHYFRSYCGGFPKVANDFKYKFSWSPFGVLKALKSSAQWIGDGEVKQSEKPWHALTEFDMTLVNGEKETFQAYPNRDSLPFREQYGFDESWNIKEFVRGTLRLGGWSDAWKSLFDEVDDLSGNEGLNRLQEISDELWDKYQYEEGEADRVVLSVELEVKSVGGEATLWKNNYSVDEAGNDKGSAMGRLVSLNVAIAIEMLIKGKLDIGVTAAPHNYTVVADWMNELGQLGENIFHTTSVQNV